MAKQSGRAVRRSGVTPRVFTSSFKKDIAARTESPAELWKKHVQTLANLFGSSLRKSELTPFALAFFDVFAERYRHTFEPWAINQIGDKLDVDLTRGARIRALTFPEPDACTWSVQLALWSGRRKQLATLQFREWALVAMNMVAADAVPAPGRAPRTPKPPSPLFASSFADDVAGQAGTAAALWKKHAASLRENVGEELRRSDVTDFALRFYDLFLARWAAMEPLLIEHVKAELADLNGGLADDEQVELDPDLCLLMRISLPDAKGRPWGLRLQMFDRDDRELDVEIDLVGWKPTAVRISRV